MVNKGKVIAPRSKTEIRCDASLGWGLDFIICRWFCGTRAYVFAVAGFSPFASRLSPLRSGCGSLFSFGQLFTEMEECCSQRAIPAARSRHPLTLPSCVEKIYPPLPAACGPCNDAGNLAETLPRRNAGARARSGFHGKSWIPEGQGHRFRVQQLQGVSGTSAASISSSPRNTIIPAN
jgi:hypothetical protein